MTWRMSRVHQQNVFWLLGASGSIWELSDQNARVVKSQSILDWHPGLQVHLEALGSVGDNSGSADHKPGSIWELQRQVLELRCPSMGPPGSAGNKSESSDLNPGSMSNDCRALREQHYLHWEHCWCVRKLSLLLIVEQFFKLMYSVWVFIYLSIYQYSYRSIHHTSSLAAGCAWEECEVDLKLTIEWAQRYPLRLWSCEFGDALGGWDQVNWEMHVEAMIERD